MERLTGKFGDKVVLPIIPMEIKNQSDLERFHKVRKKYEENTIKLAEYEDSGLSPEEVKHFKDAEEQGLLLRLPCKVGNTVYYISNGYIEPCTVEVIFLADYTDKDGNCSYMAEIHFERDDCPYVSTEIYFTDFGKTVFLTQSEAEQKLKEMNTDNGITE